MDLDAYRARAQAFATELNGAHHRRFAGLDARWDPEALHARHAGLFSDAAIDGLRTATATDPALRPLLRFAVEGRLGAAAAPADARRAQAETDEGVAAMGAALEAEPDPGRRAALEEDRLDVVARRLTAPAAEGLERVRAQARALGWPSARALLSELRGADLGALAAEAQALLRATAVPVLPGAHARHDLPHVLRAAWADAVLPADPVAHLRAALRTAGLPERFAIDAAPRPGKSPRAFCAAVTVPGDVHLVVAPRGGLPDLLALFHEAGHAVHLTHRDPAAPFEARHLTDRAETEALAFAFERLATAGTGDDRVAAHLEAVELLRARHLAATLLHGLDLLDEGPHPALRERYARRMAAATGLDWPSAPWLVTADPLLGSADYLRALGRARGLRDAQLSAALTG
ncbi:M3 family oligoendopeptidase [Baekduia soli]|uniref:M3 family oligoendopeptidase n=1 Tax=Baekduia soli TaxID=496014 RepID=A0A5B8U1Y0_9ACTN|nr:M3 family oligoendopeptidase [Baekduia soli]QEC46960.1 M3 family oligoendopeptidase [Baekduia soli]